MVLEPIKLHVALLLVTLNVIRLNLIVCNKETVEMSSNTSTDKESCASPKTDVTADVSETPDLVLLKHLMEMGMDKKLSEKALMKTKNKSIEDALDWIATLGAEEMEALCGSTDDDEDFRTDSEESDDEIYYKMIFVVNSALGMGSGKIASQVAHAAVGLYRDLINEKDKYEMSLQEWETTGEKKITVKGKDASHLFELQKSAESNDLPTYIVQDAGRTQIPGGSCTVLAIFGDEEAVNDVTGSLKLL